MENMDLQPVKNTDIKSAYRALTGGAKSLAEVVNCDIDVTHAAVVETEITDKETGEMRKAYRTVLVTAGGEVYATISSSIARCVEALVKLCGNPPWSEPIKVKVVQVDYKGRRMYRLDMV